MVYLKPYGRLLSSFNEYCPLLEALSLCCAPPPKSASIFPEPVPSKFLSLTVSASQKTKKLSTSGGVSVALCTQALWRISKEPKNKNDRQKCLFN